MPNLVDIPTTDTIQGYSYTLGARQRLDVRALPNLLAFAVAFRAEFGSALVITEAARSRPRQTALWNAWLAYVKRGKKPPEASLAAFPFTSIHDEVTHGNAVDLGGGIATFATPTHQWAAIKGPHYGVRPTGLNFSSPEPWHFDIDISTTAGSGSTPTQEDELSAAAEAQINAIHQAIFAGGPSMPDSGRSLGSSVAGIVSLLDTQFAPVQRTDGKGNLVLIPVRQDNADTKTLVIALQAQVAALIAAIPAASGGASAAVIQAAAKAGAEEALATLAFTITAKSS
ncbi:M15 family metallopeptidase [Glaciihabitans sp. UYNi722]|uniref:M15 family metallopeptidase n=1 Tax=Glaciihabitans sp. UYNi722 TaxID=3156344 RepID=UPI0033983118